MPSTPINPWYVGQTSPALQISLNTDIGVDNISGLVSSNFSLVIRNSLGIDTNGLGTFSILNSSPAIIIYQPVTADVSTAGTFNWFIKAQFPNGLKVYDPIPITISPS